MTRVLHTETRAAPTQSLTPAGRFMLQRKCACEDSAGTKAGCEACSKKSLSLQRSTRNSQSELRSSEGVPPIVHDVLRSPGTPLDTVTRAFMEPRFGHDFSRVRTNASRLSQSELTVSPANDPLEQEADRLAENALRIPLSSPSARSTQWAGADFSRVRIHTDARAADSTRAVYAKAYTIGQDIVFGPGRYAPGTEAGRKLLAHELAHTIQQSDSGTAATASLQRTLNDGHDLQSPRFAGDLVLEACFDEEDFLQSGKRGPAVEKLQQALIDAGFPLPEFGVDGIFESETQTAVRNYQRARKLGIDGIVGPITMGALDAEFPAPGPPAAPAPTPSKPSPSPGLPFGIRLPTGLRQLDPVEEAIARGVYGNSLIFGRIFLSDALGGGGGRPFTLHVPSLVPGVSGVTVINIGPGAYATPGSNPSLLIHELAHSWQSQHHPDPAFYMANSLASQAGASGAGASAYCYIPGKWFGLYGAEQIAQQVEKGEAPIISHVGAASPGGIDGANIASLAVPRWETRGSPGVKC